MFGGVGQFDEPHSADFITAINSGLKLAGGTLGIAGSS
jgi:hypothetical protein